ncbi:hypothetical protein HPB51_026487 [Rhipicephalus microplus]|uniref:Uncharacterized protein n=1 Tax=Rhipicephalus microplus TaxID=6941 RepID=A0A9J6D324_RHIMP|nr:hypothetical protein HPB51_026487 [Rhipicephalus microplus]
MSITGLQDSSNACWPPRRCGEIPEGRSEEDSSTSEPGSESSKAETSSRSYGINDFRKPLKELGIIQEVSGIGAYQMSPVWLLNMKTDEAKKTLLDAGLLSMKDRPCIVVDPREARDEEEAERSAASESAVEASHAVATSKREMETPKQDTDDNTVMNTPTQPRSTRTETQHKPEPAIGPDATSDMNTVETTPVKRRLNEGDAASQQRPILADQGQWRVAGSKKSRGAGRLRLSSLSRGGDGTTP